MSTWPLSHPWALQVSAGLALLALAWGLWAQARPGASLRTVGQRPWLLGLGMSLTLLGLGLGLAEPRWGAPEVPRLTVHVALDGSRSMLARDDASRTRWERAVGLLEVLWADAIPGVRYSLDLLTGDAIPLLPPSEDRALLKDVVGSLAPGDVGSPGSAFGRGLAQVAAQVQPKAPAIILLLSDGEETFQRREEALATATGFMKTQQVPVYTVTFGIPRAQVLPQGTEAKEPSTTQADPSFLASLAEATGGKASAEDVHLAHLIEGLAQGRTPLPLRRSTLPAHPEWGAWLGLLGLGLWLWGAGRRMARWKPVLGLMLGLVGPKMPAQMPVPNSIRAWVAQAALERGEVDRAHSWRPSPNKPQHRLLGALIDLRSGRPQQALELLDPLTGQGVPRPVPAWRAPALLMAARAQLALQKPSEATTLLERLLLELPGHEVAAHDLQSLIQSLPPPPPKPRKPPPPPPRPSQGARQDELDGLKQRLPQKPPPRLGVKDQ